MFQSMHGRNAMENNDRLVGECWRRMSTWLKANFIWQSHTTWVRYISQIEMRWQQRQIKHILWNITSIACAETWKPYKYPKWKHIKSLSWHFAYSARWEAGSNQCDSFKLEVNMVTNSKWNCSNSKFCITHTLNAEKKSAKWNEQQWHCIDSGRLLQLDEQKFKWYKKCVCVLLRLCLERWIAFNICFWDVEIFCRIE